MNEIERIENERFVESLISLWIQPDAPEWIIDYVRTELRKQRGLLEEKDLKAMEKVSGRYSEDIMDALVNLMKVFLKDHEIYKLMELVADAVATKEQENSHETCTGVSSVQDSCNPQHSKTVVRYTPDKDGWRVGAYVKDSSMFEHGNNTGK